MMKHKKLEIPVTGPARMGGLRARLAAEPPAVRFMSVSDAQPARARALAKKTGAQFHSGDNAAVISRPEVTAVIVSSSEGAHVEPLIQAIELAKPVLVEKPIALTLPDADRVIRAADKAGVSVRVGYSRRYKERYLIAKEQIAQGRLGRLVGGAARGFPLGSQEATVLRANHPPDPRGQKGVLKDAGFDTEDVSYAILTYADGAVVNLGIAYSLPDQYPARGHAARGEVLGTGGVVVLADDETDQLMY